MVERCSQFLLDQPLRQAELRRDLAQPQSLDPGRVENLAAAWRQFVERALQRLDLLPRADITNGIRRFVDKADGGVGIVQADPRLLAPMSHARKIGGDGNKISDRAAHLADPDRAIEMQE